MLDLSNITPDTWPSVRDSVFKQIVENGTPPTELETVFGAISKAIKVPKKAVAEEFRLFLGETESQRPENATTTAVQLALKDGVVLWRTPNLEAYATIRVGDHVEHHPVRSRLFRLWLSGLYFDKVGKAIYSQALNDALTQLEAKALHHGEEHPVFTRVGYHGGKVYLDLGRPDWTQVVIGRDGWEVIPSSQSPVRFRRSPYQKPLPIPKRSSGGIKKFLKLLPLKEERDALLVLGLLVGSLHPRGPYTVGVLVGPKGSGKSTVATLLKSMVDPSEAPLRSEPKNIEDLMIACANSHVICFDNLSWLAPWFSNALCRVSTGGGLSKRQLYTDTDEVVLDVRRPVLLTGISLGVLHDDLADRSVVINLERIDDTQRKTEYETLEAFEKIHAEALGNLLDGVVLALRDFREVRERFERLERMADWVVWCEAAMQAFGVKPFEFASAYRSVQRGLNQDLLESDPVARAIVDLAKEIPVGESREYSTSELLTELERVTGLTDAKVKPKSWPGSAASLGKHLPRITLALREVGVVVTSRRDTKVKSLRWTITNQTNEDEAEAPTYSTPSIASVSGGGKPGEPAKDPQVVPPPKGAGLSDAKTGKTERVLLFEGGRDAPQDRRSVAAPTPPEFEDPDFDPTGFERGDFEEF